MAEGGVAGRPGREGVWPALPRLSPASPPPLRLSLFWREASSYRRGSQAAGQASSSRDLADVEREDPDPHYSRSLCPAVPSRYVSQQASHRGPAAGARGQRDLQVSPGPSRPQAQDGWAAGQGRGAGCRAAFWVKLPPSQGTALGPPFGPGICRAPRPSGDYRFWRL